MNTLKARRNYLDALGKVATGASWDSLKFVPVRGVRAGLTEDQIIADYRAQGILTRDADVRRQCHNAERWLASQSVASASRWRRGLSCSSRRHDAYIIRALNCIERGRAEMSKRLDVADAALLPDANVMDSLWTLTMKRERLKPLNQSIALIQSISRDDRSAIFEVRADKSHRRPYMGEGIRTAGEWIDELLAGRPIGEIVSLHPLTGKQLPNASGGLSYIVRGCVAAFPFMLMEFDELPLKDQCFFWYGLILSGDLDVFSLTFSGKKSIHGIIEVDAESLEYWNVVKSAIVRRFTVPRDHPRFKPDDLKYCLDPQALLPEVGTRLAGAWRSETEAHQELLYLRGMTLATT